MNPFFDLLWEGNILPDAVSTRFVEGSLRKNAESEAWTERAWRDHVAAGNKPWPNDLKPGRYRFCGITARNGGVEVTLDPCVSYREYIATNSQEFMDTFGGDFNPHPLAISVVITAVDGQGREHVMLSVRKNVDYKAGGYHASIGGFMDIKEENDPVDTAYREVREECGVEKGELIGLHLIAAAYNKWSYHTDLVFLARSAITLEEILERKRDDENESIVFIPATRWSIEKWMAPTVHANVVIAMVGLMILGKYSEAGSATKESGAEWYDRMIGHLCAEGRFYNSPEVRMELERRDIALFQAMVAEYHRK